MIAAPSPSQPLYEQQEVPQMISDPAQTTRVVHIRDKIDGAVYIGRAMPRQGLKASPLGNPFKVKDFSSPLWAIARYAVHLQERVEAGDPAIIDALIACRNRPLACWCRHDGEAETTANACHADVIIEFLSVATDEQLRDYKGQP